MPTDFEIPVKSELENLNLLPKLVNFEKFQNTCTLEIFQTTSTFEMTLNESRCPLGDFKCTTCFEDSPFCSFKALINYQEFLFWAPVLLMVLDVLMQNCTRVWRNYYNNNT